MISEGPGSSSSSSTVIRGRDLGGMIVPTMSHLSNPTIGGDGHSHHPSTNHRPDNQIPNTPTYPALHSPFVTNDLRDGTSQDIRHHHQLLSPHLHHSISLNQSPEQDQHQPHPARIGTESLPHQSVYSQASIASNETFPFHPNHSSHQHQHQLQHQHHHQHQHQHQHQHSQLSHQITSQSSSPLPSNSVHSSSFLNPPSLSYHHSLSSENLHNHNPNHFARSPPYNSNLTTSHSSSLSNQPHYPHYYHQSSNQPDSLYSPSNFHTEPLGSHSSDPVHYSSPTWPNTQHPQLTDSLHLRHRSISLSTPATSSKCVPPIPDSRNFPPIHRPLVMPYPLHSPEPTCSPTDNYHFSLGLSNLDAGYSFPSHHSHRFTSMASNLPSRRALQPITNNTHLGPSDYISRVSSPSAPHNPSLSITHITSPSITHNTYELSSQVQLSPLNSFTPTNEARMILSPASTGQKRKYQASPMNEPSSVRPKKSAFTSQPASSISYSPPNLQSGHERMTTVLCLHASVAQKSYGQEKRFLCPPPLVRITGPYRFLPMANRPILSMSILNEEGQRHLCQAAFLGDDASNVHFKSLHISGAAKKAKYVKLELALHPPMRTDPKPVRSLGPEIDELLPPFAKFRSTDCSIISKPSKKTAKARNTHSCIFNGSTICLFNRINSQTVRTKYLCVHDGQLAARAAQWSAFIIRVVRRAEEAGEDGTPPIMARTLLSSSIPGADRTVTYGSVVELIDFVTGVSSGPLIVRKVEKNIVQRDAVGPVSQMQKLAFSQVHKVEGTNMYISSLEGSLSSAIPHPKSEFEASSEPLVDHQEPPTDHVPILMGSKSNSSNSPLRSTSQKLHQLQLQPPRAIQSLDLQSGSFLEEIDDTVAWTVIGVAHFSHSFIDLSPHYPQIPQVPITPFPTLISQPHVDLNGLTMTIRIAGFFSQGRAIEIWLGPLGPLVSTVLSTPGLSLESCSGDGGIANGIPASINGGRSVDEMQMGWLPNRSEVRQETTILVNLPPLENIYWTLHHKAMPSRALVVLDETNRCMGELVGREGVEKRTKPSSEHEKAVVASNHIPALPITLIRTDGMSFVMGHSICLSEVIDDEPDKINDNEESKDMKEERARVCVFKVI
ncbi:hypothetical protein O181_040294 [Austropuccinia psidii MF-1]|uniref:Uncharacterized protein n=1 Tax=Austropuccinia psidii MF-1 TaxID=1389203 RepID=A0A9Q3DC50_9BASI|nr:hypothetical protein [Austropuccinia psidii MF-1]